MAVLAKVRMTANLRYFLDDASLLKSGGIRETGSNHIPLPSREGRGEGVLTQVLGRVGELRDNATKAERILWRHLRTKQIHGLRFRRQLPIGPYIADFVCLKARLIVEVDGGQHADNPADDARTAWLNGQGFAVMRFWNNDVLEGTEGVVFTIIARVGEIIAALPLP